jgi:hypothetical protein
VGLINQTPTRITSDGDMDKSNPYTKNIKCGFDKSNPYIIMDMGPGPIFFRPCFLTIAVICPHFLGREKEWKI